MHEQIEQLNQMQQTKNNGRGVCCIRTIIAYLKIGNYESAKAVYYNESDKICSYPDIHNLLTQILGI